MKARFTELFNKDFNGFGFRAASGATAGSFTFDHPNISKQALVEGGDIVVTHNFGDFDDFLVNCKILSNQFAKVLQGNTPGGLFKCP